MDATTEFTMSERAEADAIAALEARERALQEEIDRVNVVKASDVIAWFEKDNIDLVLPYRVAILRDATPRVTKGGIVLPGSSTVQKRNTGTIVRLGASLNMGGEKDREYAEGMLNLRVGDRVTFSKYGESVHMLQFSNGQEVIFDVLHVRDLYFRFRNENVDDKDVSQELRAKGLS